MYERKKCQVHPANVHFHVAKIKFVSRSIDQGWSQAYGVPLATGVSLVVGTSRHELLVPGLRAPVELAHLSFVAAIFLLCAPASSICPIIYIKPKDKYFFHKQLDLIHCTYSVKSLSCKSRDFILPSNLHKSGA